MLNMPFKIVKVCDVTLLLKELIILSTRYGGVHL
jgi:hypothetical protein